MFKIRHTRALAGALLLALSTCVYAQVPMNEPGPQDTMDAGEDFGDWDRNAIRYLLESDELDSIRLNGVTHYKVTRHARGLPGLATITEYYRVERIEHPTASYVALVPVQISQQEIATLELMAQTGAKSREELSDAFRHASIASSLLGVRLDDAVANAAGFGGDGAEGAIHGMDYSAGGFAPCTAYNAVQDLSGVERAAQEIRPAVMMNGPACYYEILSTLLREKPQDTKGEAETDLENRRQAANDLQVVGIEDVGGKPSHHIRAEDLNIKQPVENGWTNISAMSVWKDVRKLVTRKQRIEGSYVVNGKTEDFVLESEYDDFRNVPGSDMYEPYRQVVRFGGAMTPEQQAEIRRAQAEMEKLERELAAMPPSQRAMMERMVGPQMEQMRTLAAGGMVEFEFITDRIEVNPENFGLTPKVFDQAPADDTSLIRAIQIDLTTLGYKPGNTDGILDTMTQVAISQYQAEAGLPVTGEPSAELASALARAVGRQ